MSVFNQTTQSFGSNNTTLNDVMMSGDLCIGGNLSVAGSISPGTFTNRVVDITGAGGATVLTASDSGTVYFVDNGAGTHAFTVSAALAATNGFNFKIIVTAANANNVEVNGAGAGAIAGAMLTVNGALVASAGTTNLIFGNGGNNTTIGDWGELQSNGTALYANAMANVASSLLTS